jgi:hypothetical protein
MPPVLLNGVQRLWRVSVKNADAERGADPAQVRIELASLFVHLGELVFE